MRRSEINAILGRTKVFLDRIQFRLPAWAVWSPEDCITIESFDPGMACIA